MARQDASMRRAASRPTRPPRPSRAARTTLRGRGGRATCLAIEPAMKQAIAREWGTMAGSLTRLIWPAARGRHGGSACGCDCSKIGLAPSQALRCAPICRSGRKAPLSAGGGDSYDETAWGGFRAAAAAARLFSPLLSRKSTEGAVRFAHFLRCPLAVRTIPGREAEGRKERNASTSGSPAA